MRVRFILLLGLLMFPLTVSAAGGVTVGQLTVTPARGPVGTTYVVVGNDFPRHTTVRLIVFFLIPTASGGQGERHVADQSVAVADDGTLVARVDSTGYPPADYTVVDAAAPGQTLAHFTVVASATALPGLPNTGGGGMSDGRASEGWECNAMGVPVRAGSATRWACQ